MVAEHGPSSMAMNNFIDKINDLEAIINPQDPVPSKVLDLFNMINNGFQAFHRQVLDINTNTNTDDANQEIINLDQATQQINANLQTLAVQVAHHQAAQ